MPLVSIPKYLADQAADLLQRYDELLQITDEVPSVLIPELRERVNATKVSLWSWASMVDLDKDQS